MRHRGELGLWPTMVLALAGSVLCGCEGVTYVLQAAQGQLQIASHVQPIADVLASGTLSAEDQAKLELIVAARQYAIDHIGLNAGESYTMYYDTSGNPLAWNLSAARQDALQPVTWTFPFVGTVPYLAFFDHTYEQTVKKQLEDGGFDTMDYELDAYSTAGVFVDPVRSPMLKRGVISLAETIIHELLHNTVWRANDTNFSESLASFVGRQGGIEFLRSYYGADSDWPPVAIKYYADIDRVNEFLITLYANLSAYYGQDLSSEAKIAGRDAVFQAERDRFTNELEPQLNYPTAFTGFAEIPVNNAWVLAYYRYNLHLDVFEGVYAASGNDWHTTLDVFRAAAEGAGDPIVYLQDWTAAHQP
jgi:predicted aminopeptidase